MRCQILAEETVENAAIAKELTEILKGRLLQGIVLQRITAGQGPFKFGADGILPHLVQMLAGATAGQIARTIGDTDNPAGQRLRQLALQSPQFSLGVTSIITGL